jgi:hypothetical protein
MATLDPTWGGRPGGDGNKKAGLHLQCQHQPLFACVNTVRYVYREREDVQLGDQKVWYLIHVYVELVHEELADTVSLCLGVRTL